MSWTTFNATAMTLGRFSASLTPTRGRHLGLGHIELAAIAKILTSAKQDAFERLVFDSRLKSQVAGMIRRIPPAALLSTAGHPLGGAFPRRESSFER